MSQKCCESVSLNFWREKNFTGESATKSFRYGFWVKGKKPWTVAQNRAFFGEHTNICLVWAHYNPPKNFKIRQNNVRNSRQSFAVTSDFLREKKFEGGGKVIKTDKKLITSVILYLPKEALFCHSPFIYLDPFKGMDLDPQDWRWG